MGECREERNRALTSDLKMRAEQGSSEEYKSQLGYPNTSKTILHISANTFGAGGPGQRWHSHACTHTHMHTCTHPRRAPSASSSSSSSSSSTSFSTSPAPLLPGKPFFLVQRHNQQQEEAAKSSIRYKSSRIPIAPWITNSRKRREQGKGRQLSVELVRHQ